MAAAPEQLALLATCRSQRTDAQRAKDATKAKAKAEAIHKKAHAQFYDPRCTGLLFC